MSLSWLNWSGSHSSCLGMRHGTSSFELRSRDFNCHHAPLPHAPRFARGLSSNFPRTYNNLALPRASSRHLMLVGIRFLFCNHASLFHSASWRRGVVCELAMSLHAIAAVVRELLSPEQWTIVRCATCTLKLT